MAKPHAARAIESAAAARLADELAKVKREPARLAVRRQREVAKARQVELAGTIAEAEEPRDLIKRDPGGDVPTAREGERIAPLPPYKTQIGPTAEQLRSKQDAKPKRKLTKKPKHPGPAKEGDRRLSFDGSNFRGAHGLGPGKNTGALLPPCPKPVTSEEALQMAASAALAGDMMVVRDLLQQSLYLASAEFARAAAGQKLQHFKSLGEAIVTISKLGESTLPQVYDILRREALRASRGTVDGRDYSAMDAGELAKLYQEKVRGSQSL